MMNNPKSFKPHIQKYFDKNLRYDGRKTDEFRELSVEKSVVKTAEGSARVKLGKTEVIAGVKMELGSPYSDTPDEGTIMIGAEFLPMASPLFESGPPGDAAVELARVVDRGIRESKAIDFKKLCIAEGKNMWIISVDICTLNDSGNLIDASAIAALAAIEDAVFPKLEKDGDSYSVDYGTKTKHKVPISKRPLAVTVHKIGNYFFVDPTSEEEEQSECRLTVASTEDGKLCALQKGGSGVLTLPQINEMIELAMKNSHKLRSKF